jgi:uncharacterized protein YjiS (DUF1127 family)
MDSKQFNNIQDPIARAEAMRAQAVAEMILGATESLGGLFRGAVAKLAAYRQFRQTFEALSVMTDRELDDIGITRADIGRVARGFDPRQTVSVADGDALARRLVLAEAFDQEEAAQPVANSNGHDNRTAVAA